MPSEVVITGKLNPGIQNFTQHLLCWKGKIKSHKITQEKYKRSIEAPSPPSPPVQWTRQTSQELRMLSSVTLNGHGQVMVRSWSGHGQVMVTSLWGHSGVLWRLIVSGARPRDRARDKVTYYELFWTAKKVRLRVFLLLCLKQSQNKNRDII